MSAWTVNGVVIPAWAESRPWRLALISLTWLYEHGVVSPSQPAGDGGEPTKWSPSSLVNTKSVLLLSIPSAASRVKNLPNAVS